MVHIEVACWFLQDTLAGTVGVLKSVLAKFFATMLDLATK